MAINNIKIKEAFITVYDINRWILNSLALKRQAQIKVSYLLRPFVSIRLLNESDIDEQ